MRSPNVSLQELGPSRLFRYFEGASVLACLALGGGLARSVVLGLFRDAPSAWLLAGALLAAFVLADLLAGLVHFACDSFGSVDTPVLGLTFVLPFRSHHVHPQDICDHDFVATNGNNAFATLFVLAPVLAWAPVDQGGIATAFGLFVLMLSALLFLTNQIHKWAHEDHPPTLVALLQRAGILLSPERHRVHHQPPYTGGYCVTSGICNRLLDPIGFFAFLERGIRRVLFLSPRSR